MVASTAAYVLRVAALLAVFDGVPDMGCDSDALERNGRSGTMERVPIFAGTERNEFHLKNHGTKRNVTKKRVSSQHVFK